MPYTLHRLFDGLFIDDISLTEHHQHLEPFFDQALKDLCLDISHDLDMDLTQSLIPYDVHLRDLFFQLFQIPQHGMDIASIRQDNAAGQHGLQYRQIRRRFSSQPLSRIRLLRTCQCADLSGTHLLHHLVFCPGIDPDLVYLLFDLRDHVLHFQLSSGHFDIGETVPLVIPCDLVDFCPELLRIFFFLRKSVQTVQQFLHALYLER